MALVLLEPKDLPGLVTLGVSMLFGLGVVIGIVWYAARRTFRHEKDTAYDELLNVATTRKERIEDLERENRELVAEGVLKDGRIRDCEGSRNEFARQNLRLQSRLEKAEKCINTLEIRLGMKPTPFDDFPTDPGNR